MKPKLSSPSSSSRYPWGTKWHHHLCAEVDEDTGCCCLWTLITVWTGTVLVVQEWKAWLKRLLQWIFGNSVILEPCYHPGCNILSLTENFFVQMFDFPYLNHNSSSENNLNIIFNLFKNQRQCSFTGRILNNLPHILKVQISGKCMTRILHHIWQLSKRDT